MRQSRYIGLKKNHLQNILTASAVNLKRWFAWDIGVLLAKTRTSRFQALAA
jgi:transposase